MQVAVLDRVLVLAIASSSAETHDAPCFVSVLPLLEQAETNGK